MSIFESSCIVLAVSTVDSVVPIAAPPEATCLLAAPLSPLILHLTRRQTRAQQ